jgi:penicillin-binding protein 1C
MRLRRLLQLAGALAAVLFALRLAPHPALRTVVPLSTAIYARDGQLLRLSLATDGQYRVWVPLPEIDARLPEAVRLYEDQWFAWHPGVNPAALLRAAQATVRGPLRQGGSTLTMQLARRVYGIDSQTLAGKLRQIAAALWLEARYSKRELLEAYLNLAPYGGNIEGVGAASLIYFHRRAQQLTLSEVLALAVIPQNPRKRGAPKSISAQQSLGEPWGRLWRRWQAKHPEDVAAAEIRSLPQLPGTSQLPFRAPHMTDRLLRERPVGEITTGLDLHAQGTLERVVAQFVREHRGIGVENASALLLDRATGEVRAMVGSADYFDVGIDGQVNGVEAKRSPGSTLKPFIYGLALDQGLLHPLTVLKDAPTAFGPFSPENFDGRFIGPVSVQDALIRSRNVPAVAVASKLKDPSLYEFLQRAGVSKLASERHYGLAIALGGGEVSMEELARLYLMLANRGQLIPLSYRRAAAASNGQQLLSQDAAFIVLQMLNANPRPDTGEPAAPHVAWKTGTSWGFRDAWTAGIFGQNVLVVWLGNFDGSGNPAFVGVKTAAPLFFRIVDSLRGTGIDKGMLEPEPPANVARIEVCGASGDLPNEFCPERATTWFIPGKSPIRVSRLHRAVQVDAQTGKPTCNHGPGTRTEVYEFWPTDMQRLFREAGMPRRQPPALPDCGTDIASDGPIISSPNHAGIYTIRLAKPVPLALRANALSSEDSLYWLANGSLLGKSRGGEALAWSPAQPGRYILRVVDQAGRGDSREVQIEFAP